MKVLGSTVEPGEPGQIRVITIIELGDTSTELDLSDLGNGPTGDAIPDRIVKELISSSPRSLSLAEIQQFVGGNPGTVARQAWTLATNAADLQQRLRGWVVSPSRGRYALSPAAQMRMKQNSSEVGRHKHSAVLREFHDGIVFWNSHRNWPADLHNADYRKWAKENPRGRFTEEWWKPFLKQLQAWIATRPIGGRELTNRFLAAAPKLTAAWQSSCEPYFDEDVPGVGWYQVKAFPEAVASIKPTLTPSAVFTSKFCHFLLPRIFPVVDNEAVGNSWPSYEQYFKFVQVEWAKTDARARSDLTTALTEVVEARGGQLYEGFPLANKIIEVRLMGRKHPLSMISATEARE